MLTDTMRLLVQQIQSVIQQKNQGNLHELVILVFAWAISNANKAVDLLIKHPNKTVALATF